MKEIKTIDEKPINKQEDYHGCYTTESLAIRLNVSKKFIVSHRRTISGAMMIEVAPNRWTVLRGG